MNDKFFEEPGILSVAVLPIFKNGSLWGFFSYADKASREWSEGEIEGLLIAEILWAQYWNNLQHTCSLQWQGIKGWPSWPLHL